jgi:hypothetical protein
MEKGNLAKVKSVGEGVLNIRLISGRAAKANGRASSRGARLADFDISRADKFSDQGCAGSGRMVVANIITTIGYDLAKRTQIRSINGQDNPIAKNLEIDCIYSTPKWRLFELSRSVIDWGTFIVDWRLVMGRAGVRCCIR